MRLRPILLVSFLVAAAGPARADRVAPGAAKIAKRYGVGPVRSAPPGRGGTFVNGERGKVLKSRQPWLLQGDGTFKQVILRRTGAAAGEPRIVTVEVKEGGARRGDGARRVERATTRDQAGGERRLLTQVTRWFERQGDGAVRETVLKERSIRARGARHRKSTRSTGIHVDGRFVREGQPIVEKSPGWDEAVRGSAQKR